MQHAPDVLTFIDAAIWSYDIHSQQFTWSAGFEKIFGLSLEEADRREELVYLDDIPDTLKHMELLLSGLPSTIDFRIIRPDG